MKMFMVFLCVVVGCDMNTEAKQIKTDVTMGVVKDLQQLHSSILNDTEDLQVMITPSDTQLW